VDVSGPILTLRFTAAPRHRLFHRTIRLWIPLRHQRCLTAEQVS